MCFGKAVYRIFMPNVSGIFGGGGWKHMRRRETYGVFMHLLPGRWVKCSPKVFGNKNLICTFSGAHAYKIPFYKNLHVERQFTTKLSCGLFGRKSLPLTFYLFRALCQGQRRLYAEILTFCGETYGVRDFKSSM